MPARVRLVGGGPTNGVPGAYLDRIHELLHVFDGHDGQQWWLDAGTNELVTAVRKRTGLGPHPLLPG